MGWAAWCRVGRTPSALPWGRASRRSPLPASTPLCVTAVSAGAAGRKRRAGGAPARCPGLLGRAIQAAGCAMRSGGAASPRRAQWANGQWGEAVPCGREARPVSPTPAVSPLQRPHAMATRSQADGPTTTSRVSHGCCAPPSPSTASTTTALASECIRCVACIACWRRRRGSVTTAGLSPSTSTAATICSNTATAASRPRCRWLSTTPAYAVHAPVLVHRLYLL